MDQRSVVNFSQKHDITWNKTIQVLLDKHMHEFICLRNSEGSYRF
jgi:hypothetical protein